MDRAFIEQITFMPVRHHSPRSSQVLQALLEQKQPKAVLVEGPCDATHLIDVLVDKDTHPPVAILAYRHDGETRSSLWPFARYSPEWIALKWARLNQCKTAFIDIPASSVLAEEASPVKDNTAEDSEYSLYESCAQKFGMRSFEEFWESHFESPVYSIAEFQKALVEWADLTREQSYADYHRSRDAFMLKQIHAFSIEHNINAEDILVVLGAAHVAAIQKGDVDFNASEAVPKGVQASLTLIPYSYPRLAEQLGYGAGNRAPYYYQAVHQNHCDYQRGTLDVLLQFSQHLRLRGFTASLADSLEAYRLAISLAQLRHKHAPGLDELREATVATLCRGNQEHVDSFLWPNVIGKTVGKVAARIGKNSLQEEFWRELDERKLPAEDNLQSFVLKLNNEVEVSTSIFLHRLRISDIPYASYMGSHTMGSRRQDEEEAGGYQALRRVREAWEAQWTPATDVALIERIALGDTLEQVTSNILQQRLQQAASAGQAADILLEAVVTHCPQLVNSALLACDHLAANDDDLPSLASACRALSGLISYGSSRSEFGLSQQAIETLCLKTFDRSLLRVSGACNVDDEAVDAILDSLIILNEVSLSQPKVNKDDWLNICRDLLENFNIHAMVPGLICGLLYLSENLDDADLQFTVSQRMSNTLEPKDGADFLAGLLKINPVVLLKNRPLVSALDNYITSIPKDRFADVLPLIRRALGGLNATERRYLVENIMVIRKLGKHDKHVRAIIDVKDANNLKDISGELDDTMDDLDDLL